MCHIIFENIKQQWRKKLQKLKNFRKKEVCYQGSDIQLGAGRWAIFSQKIDNLRKITRRHLRQQFAIVFFALCLFFFFQSSRYCFKMNIDWCCRGKKGWIGQTKKLLLVRDIFITKPAINRGKNWGIFYRSAPSWQQTEKNFGIFQKDVN